jgi:hypothetical protein
MTVLIKEQSATLKKRKYAKPSIRTQEVKNIKEPWLLKILQEIFLKAKLNYHQPKKVVKQKPKSKNGKCVSVNGKAIRCKGYCNGIGQERKKP